MENEETVAYEILSAFGEVVDIEERDYLPLPGEIEGLTYPRGIKGKPSLLVFIGAQSWEVKQFLCLSGIGRDSNLRFFLAGITVVEINT